MLGNIFKFRPRKFVGIDIGTNYIKIVELGRRRKAVWLENYGELRTISTREKPFRVFREDTLLLSDREIARAVEAICLEAGIQTKEANFSIPDFCSFFTSFQLPAMGKDELPQAVSYEVRPYIPLPLSEITLDWLVTEGEVSKTPIKVLVVAIPNDVISQYQEIARHSGLKLRVLEPEVFALARSSANDKEKITGLIDIGARSTTCNVLEKGILKVSHSFNLAGNELTQLLAKSLKIDYNKAEELKTKQGLIFTDRPPQESQQNTKKILLPLVDSILEETKKVFRDFYRKEGKEIEKIILAGGSALLPGLKEYFSTELKKETEIANPFSNVSYPPILGKILKKEGPSYAVVIGLALKAFE